MQITFTRTAILFTGIAFGFLFGCTTLFPASQEETKPNNLSKTELESELQSVNQKIKTDSANADLYYQKGNLLNELAQKTDPPEDRRSVYTDMRTSLEKAEELFLAFDLPSQNQKIDELLKVSWSNEHNQGVQIMQTDSTIQSEDLKKAAAYFNNATLILPDTAISYKMEARAYYRNHNYDKAISTLERADQHIEKLPVEMLEQLAFLYLQKGQSQKAVDIYEEAESFSDDNLNLLHGLANAYISSGSHRKAIDLLERLSENEPENIIYLEALANQYYLLAGQKFNSLISKDSKKGEFNSGEFQEADSLLNSARKVYEKALSGSSGNIELQKNVARFYQNAVASYRKVTPVVPDTQKPVIQQQVKEIVTSAIPLYESLTNQFPDDNRYWNALYQAYSYLGMTEKANEAKSNLN